MKPITSATIVVIPIGEFDSYSVKDEFDRIINTVASFTNKIIIADAIGDDKEARTSIQDLSSIEPDLLIIIALRGLSAQTIETCGLLSKIPILIWPVQGRFALPSSVLAIGALREINIPVELLYIPPDHPDTKQRLYPIITAAVAFSRLRKSRIGVIGSLFPNLVSCRYDPKTIREKFGIELLPISFDEIRSLILQLGESTPAFDIFRREISNSFKVEALDEKSLEAGISLHLVLKQIAGEHGLAGFATECWSAFPRELGLNPCMGFIQDEYTLACEGDVMLCISLLIVRYLTGANPFAGDLFDLEMDNTLTLVHCGAPSTLASDKEKTILGKSQLASERGFDTITCRPQLDPGSVTVLRLYGHACDKIHVASGELVYCETSPNLTVKVKISGNRQDFLDQCQGNHYLVVKEDIRSELKLLGKWFAIQISET